MSFTSMTLGRVRVALAGVALAVLMGLMFVATAPAAPRYNDADLTIRGGDAAAFAVCINSAKAKAKAIKRTGRDVDQRNRCDNLADAAGGNVDLNDVDISIRQRGQSRGGGNSVDLTIRGGDAVAVAACVNVAQGTYDVDQVNRCSNTAIATGGNVTLRDVDISIRQ
jgi:hypothetical protein